MLGKLLRYDFRSMGKQFSILWPAVLVVALVNKLLWALMGVVDFHRTFWWLEGSMEFFLRIMPAMLYFAVIVALIVVSLIYVLQRFYSGLLGNEGYLMHTLPVRTWQLILSKLLCATAVTLISSLVALVSIAILGADTDIFSQMLRVLKQLAEPTMLLICLHLLVLTIFGIWGTLTQIYAACAIGQLSNKNRILLSIVAYVVINIILSTLSVFVMIALGMMEESMGLVSGWLNMLVHIFRLDQISAEGAFHLIMAVLDVLMLAKSVIFFFITEYLLRRKLNLQ